MAYIRETIFALSTGLGKSAVAIVRVSGPKCEEILRRICRRENISNRMAVYTGIFDEHGGILDKGIVIYFKSPRSFTGEDMVEFQITGGQAIKVGLLRMLSGFSDTRPAEAGEFARRAFENGKMDLVQVEGLAAIVDAETAAQSRYSGLMAFGTVSQQCERARSELLTASALAEGMLDFSDIEDPDHTSIESIRVALEQAASTLKALGRNSHVTERLREGFTVAFVGPPNAGKSTLINHILQREAAIVSDVPGTTRDLLEFFVEMGGFPVILLDTAGFRAAVDPIERLGIEKSQKRIRSVDLIVWLSEGEHQGGEDLPIDVPVLKVRSKRDLANVAATNASALSISAITGHGVDSLISGIAARAASFFSNAGEAGLGTERQLAAVRDALEAIDRALTETGRPEELLAEDIRHALTALGRVTGRVDVDDILDEVFSRLCVGK